ncbi:MAG: hypothetical protein ACOX52_21890 [Verrucomicrobiota bacterium]
MPTRTGIDSDPDFEPDFDFDRSDRSDRSATIAWRRRMKERVFSDGLLPDPLGLLELENRGRYRRKAHLQWKPISQ